MSGIRLQVGKTYRARNGTEHTIARIKGDIAVNTHGFDGWYAHTGKCFSDGREDTDDLIEEVIPDNVNSIPHADLIRAVLDGMVVQVGYNTGSGNSVEWEDGQPCEIIAEMVTNPNYAYRLKPEPMIRWIAAWPGGHLSCARATKEELRTEAGKNEWLEGYKCIRLELDPDTLDVIDTRTEEP